MNDLKVFRWTGAFGLACVVLWLSQFPLYIMGSPPSVYDGAAFGQHLFTIKNIAFTRILLDQGVFVTLLVFLAGFRHLIRQARADYEWVGTLVFGAGLIWMAVTLVADGLEGGAGLYVACVPAMYFGPVDYSFFYNVGGWGPAIIANFPPAIWFLIVSILMIRKREAVAPTQVCQGGS